MDGEAKLRKEAKGEVAGTHEKDHPFHSCKHLSIEKHGLAVQARMGPLL